MSGREAYELSEQSQLDGDFGKGPGDPDKYGYPGQPEDPPLTEAEQAALRNPEPF